MNVLQVTASMMAAGGMAESVPSLCRALDEDGVRVSLHALAPASNGPDHKYSLVAHEPSAFVPRLGASRGMLRALTLAARQSDICHGNGVWLMPHVYPAWAVRGTKCRLVVSPHGMLEPWAMSRSALRKRVVWHLWQGKALRDAACFHATATSECESIRKLGFRQPVAVIPNGVYVPDSLPPRPTRDRPRRLLFLSRLHPKKGLDILVKSWRSVQDEFPDWELYVVGPDELGHEAKIKRLAREVGAQRVFFPGPAWGDQRTEAYSRADAFVLPTHSENFGIAVAEALAHGVPAIVSKGAPWADMEKHGCGWWIDQNEEALTACLRSALPLSCDELRQRGARGREWMARDFSWTHIGRMMHETYDWLLGGGAPPPFVQLA